MKIAVIGGGTAGFIAAAHITHFFPQHELYHIYDFAIDPIGVGEGTLPFFAKWITKITGQPYSVLASECDATYKYGVQFEGWGKKINRFTHAFAGGSYAYHISARKMAGLLQRYIQATSLNKRLLGITREDYQARLVFADGTDLRVDFVFDARGFPPVLDHRHTPFPEIPTNAALIQRGPAGDLQGLTRAVARSHGWIFVIPLVSRTSYGYIFNDAVTNPEAVNADFDAFLHHEQVALGGDRRLLKFPSFMQAEFFDGLVFRIGNRAAFLEPLEATAIAIILEQLKYASYWLAGAYLNDMVGGDNAPVIQALNETIGGMVRSVSLFVSWHYAMGSMYDTSFWRHAQNCFESSYRSLQGSTIRQTFDNFIEGGARIPPRYYPVPGNSNGSDLGTSLEEFGGFSELSFAQIGHGIGYFDQK